MRDPGRRTTLITTFFDTVSYERDIMPVTVTARIPLRFEAADHGCDTSQKPFKHTADRQNDN
jgi:hypothetical protein